jgi:ABC-type polar amino acid transport system ATPase subunit
VTVLLVEQKLPFARRVASRFSILEKGRSVAGGSIEELTDEVVREHLSVWNAERARAARLAALRHCRTRFPRSP